jgi:pilus assembly protein CpaF
MGGFALPSRTIREMIVSSVDVIVQAARLRDGSRRITHISEVLGFEGDVVTMQDLMVYPVRPLNTGSHGLTVRAENTKLYQSDMVH